MKYVSLLVHYGEHVHATYKYDQKLTFKTIMYHVESKRGHTNMET